MGVFDSIRSWFAPGKPAPITEPSGTDGVAAPGGYLWRGERSSELVGHRLWLTISNAITNSIIIAAGARYFLNLTAGTEWEAEPQPGASGKRGAQLIRDGLFDAEMSRPWNAAVRKAALHKFYGFSAQEWIVKRRSDGTIVFADLQHRPQYTIQWWDKPTEQSPLMGLVQQTRMGNRYYLPRERLLYCVDDTLTDEPSGMGMIRHVISHVERVQRYEQLEGVGYETDLRGIPYGRAPIAKLKAYAISAGKGPAWVEQQLEALTKFSDSHVRTAELGLVLDSSPYFDKEGHPSSVPQWSLDLLKGDGAPLEQVAAAINRVNLEIARVIGCEFMMMGGSGGQSGNRAMHEDKTDQFGNLIQSTLGEIAGYARNDLARPLIALNGLDPDTDTPTLLPGSVATEQVSQVAQSLLFLAQAGAPLMPGDPAIDQIRARLHLAEQPKITPSIAGMIPRTAAPGSPAAPTKPDDKPGASGAGDDSVDVDLDDVIGDDTAAAGGLAGT
jgi:hypothetical protein